MIFIYIDELTTEQNYEEIDEFISDFCKEDMCFQYYVCVLTCCLWVKGELINLKTLREKAIEAGTKEIGEENTIKTLTGLL